MALLVSGILYTENPPQQQFDDTQRALSTIYYVAQTRRASDSNPGTDRRNPLLTLAEAISRVNPGDTVQLLSGDFCDADSGWGQGVIAVTVSGTADQPIRFIGSSRSRVGTFYQKDAQHIVIEGFVHEKFQFRDLVKWTPMPGRMLDISPNKLADVDYFGDWEQRRPLIESAFSRNFFLIQQLEHHIAIDIENSSSITIRNNSITSYWAGIQFKGAQNIDLIDNRISHCVNGIVTVHDQRGGRGSSRDIRRKTCCFGKKRFRQEPQPPSNTRRFWQATIYRERLPFMCVRNASLVMRAEILAPLDQMSEVQCYFETSGRNQWSKPVVETSGRNQCRIKPIQNTSRRSVIGIRLLPRGKLCCRDRSRQQLGSIIIDA